MQDGDLICDEESRHGSIEWVDFCIYVAVYDVSANVPACEKCQLLSSYQQ